MKQFNHEGQLIFFWYWNNNYEGYPECFEIESINEKLLFWFSWNFNSNVYIMNPCTRFKTCTIKDINITNNLKKHQTPRSTLTSFKVMSLTLLEALAFLAYTFPVSLYPLFVYMTVPIIFIWSNVWSIRHFQTMNDFMSISVFVAFKTAK